MVLVATCDAGELGLAAAVVFRHMPAARTRPARVLRRHGDEMSAVPRQLVVQLAAELGPALIEDGLVQAGLLPDLLAVLFGIAFAGLGHIPYLQIFDAHDRVVLADGG